MVTADTSANIDAAIHVAHAFTIHSEESESDYFSVVDDLQDPDDEEEAGAAHIGDTELTAGLFYGYVVVDLPALVSNTEGVDIDNWMSADVDRTLAADIVKRLIPLIATVTPGAKLGSTAPYSWASFLMAEASARQPRSLAEAFRVPASARLDAGIQRLNTQLKKFDSVYGQGETRKFLSTESEAVEGAEQVDLQALAAWASQLVIDGAVSS
jgi:CRISPR system Cascade subunit CasC